MITFLSLVLAIAASPQQPRAPVTWDARAVEHLLNRAAFGARPGEIEQGVALGAEALVDKLVTQRADIEPPFIEALKEMPARQLKELSTEEQQRVKREYSDKDRRQLLEYMGWWIDRMAQGDDPLLDRMTLFWHGLFTSSIEQVRKSYPMLTQHQFLRANALGSYSDLLYGIAKDPAMLIFLNNNVNRKGNPNENFARELMELYSLGVGNYTESDVKEAARALTGRSTNAAGEYEYNAKQHDDGPKTVLGVSGKLDGDDLIKAILQQDACPRYVARKLITYFEGVEPAKERLDEYASFLRKNDFKLQPFLRKLFLDPAFYRDEVVGARVQGPIDFMIGMTRRLGIQTPSVVLGSGAALLGQRIFAPPSVKGWDEGIAWITTSTMMQRGNMAGLVLGLVRLDDVLSQNDLLVEPDPSTPEMDASASDKMNGEPMSAEKANAEAMKSREMREKLKGPAKPGKMTGFAYDALRRAEQAGWTPAINFSARMQKHSCVADAQIVDRMLADLLAIQAPAETRTRMIDFLSGERAQLGLRDGRLFDGGADAERVLRRLAHLILSLPEAQLM